MNTSSTTHDTAVAEPALRSLAADANFLNAISAQKTHAEGGTTFTSDIAQKVMRLTGSVRLISRSAQRWHHCGINE